MALRLTCGNPSAVLACESVPIEHLLDRPAPGWFEVGAQRIGNREQSGLGMMLRDSEQLRHLGLAVQVPRRPAAAESASAQREHEAPSGLDDRTPHAGLREHAGTLWAPGEIIVDTHPIDPTTLPPGNYYLLAGLYDPATGERLPAVGPDGPLPDYAVNLGKMQVTGGK